MSEKGIDIEMCCDALRLASAARIERLFILTNDGDFIPLFRTIKEFGTNISVIHLSSATPPNADLLREADSYDVVSPDGLTRIFLPLPSEPELSQGPDTTSVEAGPKMPVEQRPESEKPEAAPSDLGTVADAAQEE